MPDSKIILLHRGGLQPGRHTAYPPPADYAGPRAVEQSEAPIDYDRRFEGPPRHERIGSDFRDFINDIRDNLDLAIFCVTFGIIIGCLGTVLAAFAWSAAS